MNSMINAALVLTIISPLLSTPSFADDKAIYGEDDRMELFSASPETARLADSVASFWKWNQVQLDPASGTLTLKTMALSEEYSLCPGERFRDQQEGSACTGFLVGEDLIMTAGHCLIDQECEDSQFVFGFAIAEAGGKAPTRIGRNDAYACKQIVSRFAGDEPGLDYALIQLERKVVGRKPLALNRERSIEKGDKVLVIGHPLGLPLKISKASVRDVSPEVYFITDLDTCSGNSGSPVINTATGLVEGILVRGDKDFKETPAGCKTMAVYPQNSGRGEDVTRISAIGSRIATPANENLPEKK